MHEAGGDLIVAREHRDRRFADRKSASACPASITAQIDAVAENQQALPKIEGVDPELILKVRLRAPIKRTLGVPIPYKTANTRMLLARRILVEQRDDLPHHDLGGTTSKFLDDRTARPIGEFASIHLKTETIAEKKLKLWKTMTSNGRSSSQAALDHALEFGPERPLQDDAA